MKRVATILVALTALVAVAGTASAALRSPQVPIAGGSLQGYLNSVSESINVLTDQQDVQTWQSTVSNNSTFTLQIELAGNAPNNFIGIYNAADVAPALDTVFPGVATAGWFAVVSWRTAPVRAIVNLLDANANLVSTNQYLGADKNNFGFYLQGPGGTFYTQDARNAGSDPQAVTFAGTGINVGSWWLAFEDTPYAGSDHDFNDAVLFLESVNPAPVPVNKTTWGSVKARFR
jgi:hypothetical protein